MIEDSIRSLAVEATKEATARRFFRTQTMFVLADSLDEAGFQFLPNAVLCGNTWSRRIAEGEDLALLEKEASPANRSWVWCNPNFKRPRPDSNRFKGTDPQE